MSRNIDLFTATTRPASDLIFSRGDDNDRRLGEFVCCQEEKYDGAAIVLLGCPQDEGVRRNRGRVGAAQAPTEIRRALYRLSCPEFGELLFDLGDTQIKTTLEETHELQFQIVNQLVRDGKRVISLGGGNDIAYPDCRALSTAFPHLLAFNIDAHLDVRADKERNSGTPYRQLLEENLVEPAAFFEMGYQGAVNSQVYLEYVRAKGVGAFSLDQLRVEGMLPPFHRIIEKRKAPAIFWGFDVDGVRAADAPGVSAPSPLGLSAEEFCALAGLAGATLATRIIEFTEVNPAFDRDHQTSRLVAFAIHHFLTATA